MTIKHAAALYFAGSVEAAKKRVQKLKRAGLVSERPRRANERAVLFFNRQAYQLLTELGTLRDYPRMSWSRLEKRARVSPLTIAHELDVMSVKSAFATAAGPQGYVQLIEFSTWSRLFEFHARKLCDGLRRKSILVKPDAFIRLRLIADHSEHCFYLELDRSTERQDLLAQRADCYRDYYRTGGFARRHHHPQAAYNELPFRVLMVFRTAERRNNTTERLLQLQPPILRQVWLSTMSEIVHDPLGPIWIRPIDYRTVTANTRFDPELRRPTDIYRREPERERLVDASIARHSLLQASEAEQ